MIYWFYRNNTVSCTSILASDRSAFQFWSIFLGLWKEYGSFLEQLGRLFGVVLEAPTMAALVMATAAGIPSVRVIMPNIANLPKEISSLEGKMDHRKGGLLTAT